MRRLSTWQRSGLAFAKPYDFTLSLILCGGGLGLIRQGAYWQYHVAAKLVDYG